MRVFVLVAIRRDPAAPHPPSVWHLEHRTQRGSARSFRATSKAHLWARDDLFSSLQRVDADGNEDDVSRFWLFTALLDVAGCEEDVEVVAMVLGDLCRAWPGAAAHVEVCRTTHAPSCSAVSQQQSNEGLRTELEGVEREETLLVLLADAIEATAATQEAYLRRWGVDAAWDYTPELRGRCWFGEAGYVAVLPPSVTAIVESFLMWHLQQTSAAALPSTSPAVHTSNAESILDAALACATLERDLTRHWEDVMETQLVPQHLYEGGFHRAVVAVPPTMALFLSTLPSHVLHDCLLSHTHDRPLFSCAQHATAAAGGSGDGKTALDDGEEAPVVIPVACRSGVFCPKGSVGTQRQQQRQSSTASTEAQARHDVAQEESQRLANIFHEYDVLLDNKGAVRLPLPPVSRYVFTLLLCQCELPATLMAPFVRRHAAAITNSSSEEGERALTEEEVVLGIKVSWAVGRWTAMLRSPLRQRQQTLGAVYAQWACRADVHSDSVVAWVEAQLHAAQRAVKRLSPVSGDGDSHAALSSPLAASFPQGTVPRHQALRDLEVRLFAPHPLSYRGSSTEWLLRAVQEAGQQFAQVPPSLMEDADLPGAVPSVPTPAAAAAATAPSSADESDSEEGDDSSEDDGSTVDSEDAASETLLLQHMDELQAVLRRQPPAPTSRAPRSSLSPEMKERDDAVLSEDDLSAWLTAEDMAHVSRNELFLQHVQLLGAELGDEGPK